MINMDLNMMLLISFLDLITALKISHIIQN